MNYTIKKVSEMTGLSIPTIRYWRFMKLRQKQDQRRPQRISICHGMGKQTNENLSNLQVTMQATRGIKLLHTIGVKHRQKRGSVLTT